MPHALSVAPTGAWIRTGGGVFMLHSAKPTVSVHHKGKNSFDGANIWRAAAAEEEEEEMSR